ncbi:phage holin family protein [Persicobacter psychrovividus]|uniref:Phage holin family protein n=1 Tax=Persicobacter psychrovividus TaxID=387638 RepID=A0ABN6L8W1_9BACT|nr:hypothetical protein PEPS_15240 [Persicobacter psychrovividus]
MKQYIINLIVTALAVLISVWLFDLAQITGDSRFFVALSVAFVLSILNFLIRPVLLVLTLPINVITLGLFTFVVNALVILMAGGLIDSFHVSGFWSALFFSIVLSIVQTFLEMILGLERD